MTELIIGLVGMVVWGLVCTRYFLRDREFTVVMLLPFILFLVFISRGWSQLI